MARSLITRNRTVASVQRNLVVASSLRTNLVEYWKLEEASGNRVGVNGTILTPAGAHLPGQGAGKLGNGATFTALSTDNLGLAAASAGAFEPGFGSFSAQIWANLTALGADRLMFGKQISNGVNSHFSWRLNYQNSGTKLTFFIFDTAASFTPSASTAGILTINAGQWYHLVGVVDWAAQVMMLYVNGKKIQTTTIPAGLIAVGIGPASDAELRVGNFGGTSNGSPNGTLDAPAYWSRALTPSEVLLLWNNGNGREYPWNRGLVTSAKLRTAA